MSVTLYVKEKPELQAWDKRFSQKASGNPTETSTVESISSKVAVLDNYLKSNAGNKIFT